MILKNIKLLILLFVCQVSFSQEGIAVYSDYLTDNYYLLHPSMAGASNCSKIRLTARNQWFGNDDAPALQTLSFNGKIGDRGSAIGAILFNDKNGYHSQKGAKITYAHHLMFSRSNVDLNQLSFGLSAGLVQNQLDESSFDMSDFDPIIAGIIQRSTYFNVDFGASYNYLDFYVHATVKNALFRSRDLYSDYESDNLRKYLLSGGYVFGNPRKLLWEPSVLFQLTERTKEKSFDANLKVYKTMDFGKIWGGLSYRRSFDGAQYLDGTELKDQKLQYITPLIGVNYKKFMFAYTYSNVMGDIKFETGGFHQITLGFDFGCKKNATTVTVRQLIKYYNVPIHRDLFLYMVIKEVNGKFPQIPADCYVAENATIVGDVTFGEQCSVWFNAVVRGDVHYIKVGNKVNIQDGAVIHCTYQKYPTVIGNNVSIGHNAIVHGCTLKDNVLIGMGAIVMDGCVIESNSIVAAGSVVTQNTVVESGTIYAGIPAKKVKDIDQSDFAGEIERISNNYVMYSGWFK